MEKTIPQAQFVVNAQGKKTGVLLSLKQYQKLLEDLHDLAVIAERRDEEPISLAEMQRRLQYNDGYNVTLKPSVEKDLRVAEVRLLAVANDTIKIGLVPINLATVPHSIQEDLFCLNVITDTVVTHADAPLTDSDICESCALEGIFSKAFKHLKHASMHLGIESTQVLTETTCNNQSVAGHIMRIAWTSAVPWLLLYAGRDGGRLRLRPCL